MKLSSLPVGVLVLGNECGRRPFLAVSSGQAGTMEQMMQHLHEARSLAVSTAIALFPTVEVGDKLTHNTV